MLPRSMPPVGSISPAVAGPRHLGRRTVPVWSGNTLTTSAPACHAFSISVGVNAPGITILLYLLHVSTKPALKTGLTMKSALPECKLAPSLNQH